MGVSYGLLEVSRPNDWLVEAMDIVTPYFNFTQTLIMIDEPAAVQVWVEVVREPGLALASRPKLVLKAYHRVTECVQVVLSVLYGGGVGVHVRCVADHRHGLRVRRAELIERPWPVSAHAAVRTHKLQVTRLVFNHVNLLKVLLKARIGLPIQIL